MTKTKRNAAIAILLLLAAMSVYEALFGGPKKHPLLLSQVRALSDLVTVQHVTEQFVQAEDSNILSTDRIILIAHGVIKAGVKLDRVKAEDIRAVDKTLSLHLPPSEITDTYLDEALTEVALRQTGWFIWHRKDLETEARQKALATLVDAARKQGIEKEAEAQAKTVIAQFFKALGYDKVEYF